MLYFMCKEQGIITSSRNLLDKKRLLCIKERTGHTAKKINGGLSRKMKTH